MWMKVTLLRKTDLMSALVHQEYAMHYNAVAGHNLFCMLNCALGVWILVSHTQRHSITNEEWKNIL